MLEWSEGPGHAGDCGGEIRAVLSVHRELGSDQHPQIGIEVVFNSRS